MILTNILIALYYIGIVLVCLKVIVDTQSTTKALAYLFLIIIFPIGGAIIYFSFGVNYRKKKLYDRKLGSDLAQFQDLENKVFNFSRQLLVQNQQTLAQFYPLARMVSREGKSLTTTNNEVALFINGEEKFPDVLQTLQRARHHIHIEYYIYEGDEIGTQIADILIKKANEGVKVRFIYDDFGSKNIRKTLVRRLKQAGVEAVPFYKIRLLFLANSLNYRNHRKIIVVDGITAYVGGINVCDKYINTGNNKLFWRDTHLKIFGLGAANLQYIFLTDWNFCARQSVQLSEELFPGNRQFNKGLDHLVQISASGPDSVHPSIMYALMQAIMLSKEEVLITTPYFIPEKSFIDALTIAALSGISIKILVPGVSDSFVVNAASNSYYESLLQVGIEIYKYQKGFVHSKTMVCDEFVSFIGTANLDQRSFDLNFEVNAIVYDKKISKQLRANFLKDIEEAEKLKLEDWIKRPYHTILIEKIIRLFSPLL